MIDNIVFIGAGGHANSIYEVLKSANNKLVYYNDSNVDSFFSLKKITDNEMKKIPLLKGVLSIGGVNINSLQRRFEIYKKYKKMTNMMFPYFAHKTSIVSNNVKIGAGTTVGINAIINSNTIINESVIINTGSIIEHDVVIQDGAHICPGAIVLGGAKIGKCSLIGAGAVVLPNAVVPDGYLVKANTRFMNE